MNRKTFTRTAHISGVGNKCNSTLGVRWVYSYSYANADKTKTFCIYEAPNEQAIRDAAVGNKIPVDEIVEVPVVLMPQ